MELKVTLEVTLTSRRINSTSLQRLRITSNMNQHNMMKGNNLKRKMLRQEYKSMGGKSPV